MANEFGRRFPRLRILAGTPEENERAEDQKEPGECRNRSREEAEGFTDRNRKAADVGVESPAGHHSKDEHQRWRYPHVGPALFAFNHKLRRNDNRFARRCDDSLVNNAD